jgi:exopolysaccharide biosynthesis polyprenyl glycosylphosphotransferase
VSSFLNGRAAKSVVNNSASTVIDKRAQCRRGADGIGLIDDIVDAEILSETAFARMLHLERRRTDRSSRRFILMLIESGALLKRADENSPVQALLHALSHSTRETDIKGWYKEDSVFGVIFTEIGDGDTNVITKVLLDKVTHTLCNTAGIDTLNEIRFSFHVYPENISKGGTFDLTLYPDQRPDKRVSRPAKRAMDILGSLFALILLLPLFLAIAATIKLTSAGPVLFRQKRIGQHGASFTFLKFRSMHLANDETIHREYVTRFIKEGEDRFRTQNTVYKLKNDPRITPVGRLLRKTSLDELPQFLNVLWGDMSLVGPRPPIPYEVNCYNAWHKRRLAIKPGITGLWQVHGRSRVPFDGMVRLDLEYAASWSLALDIKILLKTPWAVLIGDGAC